MKANLDTANKNGFIYDIAIDESQRGKGYGRQAMQLIEEKARELGLRQMGLHVFAKNKVALNLYESLGYETKSLNMIKDLK
jgi:ribosomal protein S18 acetylase RimI-like enzyme